MTTLTELDVILKVAGILTVKGMKLLSGLPKGC